MYTDKDSYENGCRFYKYIEEKFDKDLAKMYAFATDALNGYLKPDIWARVQEIYPDTDSLNRAVCINCMELIEADITTAYMNEHGYTLQKEGIMLWKKTAEAEKQLAFHDFKVETEKGEASILKDGTIPAAQLEEKFGIRKTK